MGMILETRSKRDAIITAAADRFAASGFAHTRISDIAHLAEIGKGTVYEYFNDKEALLLETCLWCCKASQDTESEFLRHIDPENPVVALSRLMRAILTLTPLHSMSYSRLFFDLWAVAREQPVILAQARERLQEVYRDREQMVMQLIAAGEEAGYFRSIGDAKQVSRCFTACVDGFMWQATFRADLGPERMVNDVVDFFIQILLREPQRLREFCPLEAIKKAATVV
jgi:AcrR family transcriptional regulator